MCNLLTTVSCRQAVSCPRRLIRKRNLARQSATWHGPWTCFGRAPLWPTSVAGPAEFLTSPGLQRTGESAWARRGRAGERAGGGEGGEEGKPCWEKGRKRQGKRLAALLDQVRTVSLPSGLLASPDGYPWLSERAAWLPFPALPDPIFPSHHPSPRLPSTTYISLAEAVVESNKQQHRHTITTTSHKIDR